MQSKYCHGTIILNVLTAQSASVPYHEQPDDGIN